MGMEINKNSTRSLNQEKTSRRLQKEEEKVKRLLREEEKKAVEKSALQNDSLQKSNRSSALLKQSENMGHPLLCDHTSRFKRMSDALVNAQQTFQLPSPNDLLMRLSPEIQRKIQTILDESQFDPSGKVKIQKFFETLSRLIPMGIALFHGLSSEDRVVNLSRMRSSLINTLNEMGDLMLKYSKFPTHAKEGKKLTAQLSTQLRSLPMDISQTSVLSKALRTIIGSAITPHALLTRAHSTKQLISEITESLKGRKSFISVANNQKLIAKLVDANLLQPSLPSGSEIQKSVLADIKDQLERLQLPDDTQSSSLDLGKPMSQSIGFLASFLNQIAMFPEKTQSKAIKLMISTQPFMTAHLSNQALGLRANHFAHRLAHIAVDYSQQLGLISNNAALIDSATEYLTCIFTSLFITASVLGRLEVDRGDGTAMRLEDEEIGKVQREAAEELQLHHLPPFSFFALWAPFRDLTDNKNKSQKEAAHELAKFMHILMQLVYLLVAIYTGGKKMGEGGIETLLKENQQQISYWLDDLIFLLKKLDEKFGVRTRHPIERCMRSRDALKTDDFSEFWTQIFLFCQEKSDLKDFLDEVDLMDSFYNTIKTLVSGSGFDTSSVRM